MWLLLPPLLPSPSPLLPFLPGTSPAAAAISADITVFPAVALAADQLQSAHQPVQPAISQQIRQTLIHSTSQQFAKHQANHSAQPSTYQFANQPANQLANQSPKSANQPAELSNSVSKPVCQPASTNQSASQPQQASPPTIISINGSIGQPVMYC